MNSEKKEKSDILLLEVIRDVTSSARASESESVSALGLGFKLKLLFIQKLELTI